MAWKDDSFRLKLEHQSQGLELASEEMRALGDSAKGWAIAAAWLGKTVQASCLRTAFETWRNNATVSFAQHIIEEEEVARAAAEGRADDLQAKSDRIDHMQQVW